jgi:hypothetical protein
MIDRSMLAGAFVLGTALFSARQPAAALDAAERAQLIPALCAALQNEYVYPDLAKKMADALQADAQRGDYASISDPMDGNVGYVDLRSFYDPYLAADAMSAAMHLIAHTDALILDLRENRGGEPTGVAFFESFLFDTRTHLNDILVRRGDRVEQYWTSQVEA